MREIMTAFLCTALLAACTTPGPKSDAAKPSQNPSFPKKADSASFTTPEGVLSDAVHEAAERLEGGLVVLSGLEYAKVPPIEFRNATLHDAGQRLANEVNCVLHEGPLYDFMLPRDSRYDPLLGVSLEGVLSPEYEAMSVALDFGPGIPLFNVCYMISRTLGITLVADNILAETRCGQIALGQVPLARALEALLKSARLPPGSVAVDCTDEYVYLHTPAAPVPRHLLIAGEHLSPSERDLLTRKVSVVLPEPNANQRIVPRYAGGVPLRALLPALSRQLGVRVQAEQDLGDIPINPVVMNDVSVGTALDLLIRQWPQPLFGYGIVDDTIVIRQRPLDAAPAP